MESKNLPKEYEIEVSKDNSILRIKNINLKETIDIDYIKKDEIIAINSNEKDNIFIYTHNIKFKFEFEESKNLFDFEKTLLDILNWKEFNNIIN